MRAAGTIPLRLRVDRFGRPSRWLPSGSGSSTPPAAAPAPDRPRSTPAVAEGAQTAGGGRGRRRRPGAGDEAPQAWKGLRRPARRRSRGGRDRGRAALRELHEETTLVAEIDRLLWTGRHNDRPAFYFLMTAVRGCVELSGPEALTNRPDNSSSCAGSPRTSSPNWASTRPTSAAPSPRCSPAAPTRSDALRQGERARPLPACAGSRTVRGRDHRSTQRGPGGSSRSTGISRKKLSIIQTTTETLNAEYTTISPSLELRTPKPCASRKTGMMMTMGGTIRVTRRSSPT